MPEVKLENYSLPFFIIQNGIKNEKDEPLEFKDHLFLFDILRDYSPVQIVKKCAQVGLSVSMNLKTFFMADKMGLSTIYTMPSDSDVEEFVKTKTDKIFQANEVIRKRIRLDNVGLKQIGNVFIYFKGTRSKAAPISTTTDTLMHDELDRSDLNIIEQYTSRISSSKFKRTWYFSNPSLKGVGVDNYWKKSDKKEWFITCLGCNAKQYLTYERNVSELQGVFICGECGKELTYEERRGGKWEKTGIGEVSGYHISQLMATWVTAKELIVAKEEKGVEYFMNFVLGEPYAPGEGRDFRTIITDDWTSKSLDVPPLYMGVDVGAEKHWVLGNKDGIFKIGKCKSREELEDVIRKYNPITVMDSGPERTWAEEFRKKFPKIFLAFYRQDKNIAQIIQWGGDKGNFEDVKNWGYVWIDRNRVIDGTVHDMQRGEIMFDLPKEELEKMIQHWETMSRIQEDTPLGTKRYVWVTSTGVNHWASALWFYWIARKRSGIATEILKEPSFLQPRSVVVNTPEGQKLEDLEQIMEEAKYDY